MAQDPRGSGFDVRSFTGQEGYVLRNHEVRFPDSSRAVDHSWTGGINPEFRGSTFRGFRPQETLVSWIRDPRNPEKDVARWVPKTEWETGVKA